MQRSQRAPGLRAQPIHWIPPQKYFFYYLLSNSSLEADFRKKHTKNSIFSKIFFRYTNLLLVTRRSWSKMLLSKCWRDIHCLCACWRLKLFEFFFQTMHVTSLNTPETKRTLKNVFKRPGKGQIFTICVLHKSHVFVMFYDLYVKENDSVCSTSFTISARRSVICTSIVVYYFLFISVYCVPGFSTFSG